MAEVLLFHHALGRTPGVLAFAERLREAGHIVHTPDLYEGRLFPDLEAGLGHSRQVGFETLVERGVLAAQGLPHELVYAGFSLGVLPAQKLAQTRPGARGALLFSACIPVAAFGSAWPAGVPLQIHAMEADPIFADEGDLEAARELVSSEPLAELRLYPGNAHLFADSSLASYDENATALLVEHVMDFLANREVVQGFSS